MKTYVITTEDIDCKRRSRFFDCETEPTKRDAFEMIQGLDHYVVEDQEQPIEIREYIELDEPVEYCIMTKDFFGNRRYYRMKSSKEPTKEEALVLVKAVGMEVTSERIYDINQLITL